MQHLPGVLELARRGEVAALRHPLAVHALQSRGEHGGIVRQSFRAVLCGREVGLEVPVARRAERDPLALPVHDETRGDRLDAAGRQPRHDLLPQHGGDLVAVEAVKDAPGLVGVDLAVVELGRVGDGAGDRLGGDLVEDHPLGGHLGLELFLQVPGDGLALAVLVSGEVELVGVLEQRLELGDLLLLVAGHDVQGLEVVVHVDTEARPGLRPVLLGYFRGLVGHVANVADARFDHIALAQVTSDGPGLRGGLDDDEPGAAAVTANGRAAVALAAPLSPFSEAAAVFPAALLLAGTLFPTSHQRHGPSTPERAPRHVANATPAASTIRGAATKCPSLPLSLQPG